MLQIQEEICENKLVKETSVPISNSQIFIVRYI